MTIARFGPITFEVSPKLVRTFDGFTFESSISSEDQNNDNEKPVTVSESIDLDSMAFNIKLSASLGVNPRREFEKFIELKNSLKEYPFILGKRPYGGMWKLQSVSKSDVEIGPEGEILQCTLALKFKEFTKFGKKNSTDKKKQSTNKKDTGSVTQVAFKPDRQASGRMY